MLNVSRDCATNNSCDHARQYDDKLPTESELIDEYKVGRNTIRKALDIVAQKGLIRRIQGSGYYVNHLGLSDKDNVLNLSLGIGQRFNDPITHLTSKVITFDQIKADEQMAKMSQVEVGTELYRIFRLRYWHHELYNLEKAYFVKSITPYLTIESAETSIFSFIQQTYGIEPTNSENFITMERLSAADAELLGFEPGHHCITQRQVNFLKNSYVFNFSTSYYADPKMSFYFHSSDRSSN
ncbi:transcription regulator [Lactobacillus selangorensis]|uniref:Transcription regulator n=1 Tax=Lactobacillus selangorensis TaxID=81857 RepID=A0A0R2FK24_9LACO|nr:transcription regulator [Lactobacillus selangorensis]